MCEHLPYHLLEREPQAALKSDLENSYYSLWRMGGKLIQRGDSEDHGLSGGPSPTIRCSVDLKKKALSLFTCHCLSLPLHLHQLISPSPVLDLSPPYSLDLSPFLSLRLSISLSSLSLNLSFPHFLRRVVPSSIYLQQSKKVEERRENRSCNHQDGRQNVFYLLRLFGGNIGFMVLRMKRSTRVLRVEYLQIKIPMHMVSCLL
ncbi:uncharacterized protein LOC131249628 [Magnolia sinica]|uniref:uncharacterized protein LOC131249628 n=1 Tax=Magnolia sinica TaxID=86752 RepID=UPI002659CBE3|nr:uncharacterized protein LOC131249628 [Magnolia sinica]